MKRLVVCADGTWKSRDDSEDATNVEQVWFTGVLEQRDGAHERTPGRTPAKDGAPSG